MRFLSLFSIVLFVSVASSASQLCSMVMGTQSRSVVTSQNRALVTKVAQDTLADSTVLRLTEAQIIHSNFLSETLSSLEGTRGLTFNFNSPKAISLLDRRQTSLLANHIYEKMKDVLNTGSRAVTHLDNPRAALKLFAELSKSEIVDKIEESLIVVGMEGKFTDYKADLKRISEDTYLTHGTEPTARDLLRLISPFIGVITNFATGLAIQISSGAYNSQISSGEIGGLAVGTAMTIGPLVHWQGSKLYSKYKTKRNRLKSHDKIDPRDDSIDLTSMSYVPGQTRENITRIKEEFKKISESDPSSSNLRTFGSQSVQLHRELNLAFHTDFMRWMSMYEQNRTEIRKRMIEIREGKLGPQKVSKRS